MKKENGELLSVTNDDLTLLRENPEVVKENIKKKYQDHKLVLVDEVIELDIKNRQTMGRGDELRNERKTLSNQIGSLMKEGKKEEALTLAYLAKTFANKNQITLLLVKTFLK